ncbi:ACT domain-containing protein [Enterococcus nangangensis]
MRLKNLQVELSVIQAADFKELPWGVTPLFIAETTDEHSVVLPTAAVPQKTLQREDGWCALKVEGVLDFSLVGILAGITSILAAAKISIFVVSTYNTDYILLKAAVFPQAQMVLVANGYEVV